MAKISTGALADEIAAQFMPFFDDWLAKIERLNSMLRSGKNASAHTPSPQRG